MKNITLSAQDEKIDALRRVAKATHRTVNDLFRDWLDETIAAQEKQQREKLVAAFKRSLKKVNYVKLDRKYTRQEMNER